MFPRTRRLRFLSPMADNEAPDIGPPTTVLETLVSELSIVNKAIEVVRLPVNWAQREYLEMAERQLRETGRIRLIVLKARQLGISTITEALMYKMAFVMPRYRGLVVTHEIKASQNLLNMTQFYWDSDPYRHLYSTRFQSRNDLAWRETGSSIKIDTAGKKGGEGVGRSSTTHFLHASEVAFWDEPENVMLGLRQTIPSSPGTGIVLESTANGIGNYFQRQWDEAVSGESDFAPLFFPWWKHYEYTADWASIPTLDLRASELTAEERVLRNTHGVNDSRLSWRRWAIRNLCNGDLQQFMQEYPASPEDAFIASGMNVFPYKDLTQCFHPEDGHRGELLRDGNLVTFQPSDNGRLTIFSAPSTDLDYGNAYLVTGDPTHTTRGDFAVAQVINRRTLEQVAEWRGKIDPATFGEELFRLALFYNTALCCSEIEGPGYSTIGVLLGMNYPRVWNKARPDRTPGKVSSDQYGWSTTAQSKQLMIGALLKSIVDHDLIIHSRTLFQEMRDYVTLENGGFGPADDKNGHDDTVMAMAQALAVHRLEGPVMAYGSSINPMQPNIPDFASWEEWN